jgi:hypothetical protein
VKTKRSPPAFWLLFCDLTAFGRSQPTPKIAQTAKVISPPKWDNEPRDWPTQQAFGMRGEGGREGGEGEKAVSNNAEVEKDEERGIVAPGKRCHRTD